MKAPLVLSILDRRITKTDKLFGLSRVIPKIFLQAMSNDLVNGNNLSTSHFQRVCEKVAHHKLEAFFQNWVYGNGTPIFRITQKFNRKRVFIEMTIRQMQASSLNNDEDNMANKDLVRKDQTLNFVDQANTFLIDHQNLKVQPAFLAPSILGYMKSMVLHMSTYFLSTTLWLNLIYSITPNIDGKRRKRRRKKNSMKEMIRRKKLEGKTKTMNLLLILLVMCLRQLKKLGTGI